jgi:hypothetical protein
MLCPLNGASATPENIKALTDEIAELEKLPQKERQPRAIKGLKTLRSTLQDRLKEERELVAFLHTPHPLRR